MELPFPLLWKLLVSVVGMFWFGYGRRKKEWVPTIGGVALMLMPYFVPNALLLVAISLLLGAVAWKLEH